VQNWFSIETEAVHRHFERKRELAAEAKFALAHGTVSRPRRRGLPRLTLSGPMVNRLALPRWSLAKAFASRQGRACEGAAGD
jgi:hypothetical protein